jgi:hypothetical protein
MIDSHLPDIGLKIYAALGQGKNITLNGDYKADYSGGSGLPTLQKGPLQISSGKVSVQMSKYNKRM